MLRAENIGGGQKKIDVDRTFSGLVAGDSYTLDFEVLFVNKPVNISGGTISAVISTVGSQSFSFVASGTSLTLNFSHQSGGAPARIEMDNMVLTRSEELTSSSCEPVSNIDYRFAFNGMEKDDEVKEGKGNSYTTFFRQYDPRLGRWLTIDPEYSAWESPYAGMGNTPIQANDVLGNKFTKRMKQEVKQYKKQIRETRRRLSSDIRNYTPGSSPRTKDELKQRKKDLKEVKKELNALRKSPQLYDVRFDKSLGGEGRTSFEAGTGIVEITINADFGADFESYMGTFAHEMTHAYQFQTGRLSLSYLSDETINSAPPSVGKIPKKGGGSLYDKTDELEAYYRDYLITNPHYSDEEVIADWDAGYGDALLPGYSIDINSKGPETEAKTSGQMIIDAMGRYNQGLERDLEVIIGWEKHIDRKNLKP